MKRILIALFFLATLAANSQSADTSSVTDSSSSTKLNNFFNNLVFEGSSYINFVDSDLQFLNQNNTFSGNFLVLNAGVYITESIVVGLTTLDSKIDGKIRYIHQYFFNYMFFNKPKFKAYYSHKLPTNDWEEINNNRFKYSRSGIGMKIRIYNTDKLGYFLDTNYDFMVSQKTADSRNEIVLLGFSLKFN